jgi:hypothetical protein
VIEAGCGYSLMGESEEEGVCRLAVTEENTYMSSSRTFQNSQKEDHCSRLFSSPL